MKRINALQYKKLTAFCKEVFRKEKFISQRAFNLLIQQNLSQMSTRYRREMLSLQMIKEKNRLITPGPMLTHFKLVDYRAMIRLQKHGRVDIIDDLIIRFSPKDGNGKFEFPEHWGLVRKTRSVLMFTIKSN